MRKQTKIAALVSAAALLAIGASMTASAAGWNSLGNGDAEYLDADGYRVTSEWKKYTDGKWYYLKDDGLMARDELVPYEEYLYYVNADGSRVLGEWRYEANTDGVEVNDNVPDGLWYYFDATTGRAKTGTATIDGQKFRFDEDGHVIAGWYPSGDDWYYYEDRVAETDHTYGAALTSWQLLVPRNGDEPDDQDITTVYYYFDSNGKSQTGSVYYQGTWYYLDENGQMAASGWTEVEGNKAQNNLGTPSEYMYAGSDGAKATGWQYVSDKGLPTTVTGKETDCWFYLTKKGVRFIPGTTGTVKDSEGNRETAGLATINKKNYLFDTTGRMLSGFYTVDNGGDGIVSSLGSNFTMKDGETYLFSTGDHPDGGKNGWMITNEKWIESEDGNDTYYQFAKDGHLYKNAIVNNVYYDENGKRADAFDDYDVPTVSGVEVYKSNGAANGTVANGAQIIVNSKGVAQKNRKVSNVYGYASYYVGTKMPSAKDLTSGEVEWSKWVKDLAAVGELKLSDVYTNKDTATTNAQADIAAVSAYVKDADNKVSGYEIVAVSK